MASCYILCFDFATYFEKNGGRGESYVDLGVFQHGNPSLSSAVPVVMAELLHQLIKEILSPQKIRLSPEKGPDQQTKIVFQPSFFTGVR